MGGLAFEAMGLGCRVMTRIDIEQTARFFGAPRFTRVGTPPRLTAEGARRQYDVSK
jgi:hypothetical protein